MKTCKYCGNKYDDTWYNWWSKYCCNNCYKTSNTKYNIGDTVYSYYNTKVGRNGLLTAVSIKGTIASIYKLNRPTLNGLYQYSFRYDNPMQNKLLNTYRFVHQIFESEEECKKYVEVLNKQRAIKRDARIELKKVMYEN